MKSIQLTILLLAGTLLYSCERDAELRNAGLTVSIDAPLATSQSSIDIDQAENIQITAQLTAISSWTVQIVGQSTSLRKTFTGNGDTIDLTWNGSSDVPGLNNETANIYLLTNGGNDTLSLTSVEVSGSYSYSDHGAVIADFVAGQANVAVGYVEPGESILMQKQAFYYDFTGIDASENWFIGTVKFSPYTGDDHFDISSTDPSNVYLNLFVYGTGSTSTNINIDLQEDDNGDGGAFADASDDAWTYGSIVPSWDGWQLVSIKLSEFNRSTQAAFGGSGNGVQEINYIKHFQVVLGSTVPTDTAVAKIAYPIFTEGSPFMP